MPVIVDSNFGAEGRLRRESLNGLLHLKLPGPECLVAEGVESKDFRPCSITCFASSATLPDG
jgi:hypothetical protein